jgi:hypothetical protein
MSMQFFFYLLLNLSSFYIYMKYLPLDVKQPTNCPLKNLPKKPE